MPTERHAVCSALGRLAITGPTSQAAANSSAVLPRMTAKYSSSVVAVFFAAASCMTSPSAIVAAADDKMSSARSEPTSTIMQQGGGMHELDGSRELDMAVTRIAGQIGHRQRQHRAQPFSARRNQVVCDLWDHGDFGTGARKDCRVDPLHIGGDKLDQLINRGVRGAFEGYNNRHAGLHICPIGSILGYNNRKCGLARQGHEVQNPLAGTSVGSKEESQRCGNWFGPTILCWFQPSARCSTAQISIIWCWIRT